MWRNYDTKSVYVPEKIMSYLCFILLLGIFSAQNYSLVISNPLSSMTHFHIDSAYYIVILSSFRNLCRIEIVRALIITLLTSIDPS